MGTALRTDRGLIKVILLSLITFGIYGIYFQYTYIRDVNVACAYDGKKTKGLLALILLTAITFGIYYYVHLYGMADRIQAAGVRYNIHIPESGSTIFCWSFFGVLLFGLGPIIAQYLMIKNLNAISFAYNQTLNAQQNVYAANNVTPNM